MNSQTNNQKRFYIHTLGCKVNQYESQAMREILKAAGFLECLSREIADIYIINTCTVTHRADSESRHWIGFFHRMNPGAKIVVTGCYVEKDSSDISFLPGVSHIVGNAKKGSIARILGSLESMVAGSMNAESVESALCSAGLDEPGAMPLLSITDFKDHDKAFVKIQDGCENACSYCKVPLVRPFLQSKPIDRIAEEVGVLAGKGFKEIVLAGICLGAWGRELSVPGLAEGAGLESASLVDVLKAIDKIPGDFRVRLSSIEPKYVTNELVEFMSKNRRICRHLHIPLQSGDDEILKKMNRQYTARDYLDLADRARKAIKDVAITTDLLIGFPGETDEHFKNTLGFVKELVPSRTHIFTFSKREGTCAFAFTPEVKEEVIKRRYHTLNVATLSASYLYRRRFLNERLDVLVETRRERYSGLLAGYTDNYIKVLFEGPDELTKRIVPIRIEDLNLIHTRGIYEPI